MFVMLCYDADKKRDPRLHKTVSKYLRRVQRSVFEGEITHSKLNRLKTEIANILEPSKDSVVIYALETPSLTTREQLGCNYGEYDGFL